MRTKTIVVGAAIVVALAACLYGWVAYASLRGEFRSLGLR
jgi:hypothetical protein